MYVGAGRAPRGVCVYKRLLQIRQPGQAQVDFCLRRLEQLEGRAGSWRGDEMRLMSILLPPA